MKTIKNPWERFRFEFALYINEQSNDDNKKPIICKRKFDIRDYNKEVIRSTEIKELSDRLTSMNTERMGLIPNYLKKISKRQCWSEYNPYRIVETEVENKKLFDNEDVFTFEIRIDDKSVIKSSFSANWFQKDVRYGVDIREIIPEIIKEIDYFFTRDTYTLPYSTKG
jgi:hypothetical protein